jgi:hypothetical protein
MPKFVMIATANAKPGMVEEFKHWYETYHLPEICAVPGILSGRRLEAVEDTYTQPPTRFVTVYELETDHPNTVLAEMARRTAAGEMHHSASLDPEGAGAFFYRQI